MKTVQIQSNSVKQHAELAGGVGRQGAGLAHASLLYAGQQRADCGGDRNRKGFICAALGAGKGDGTGVQVDTTHGDLRLGEAAACGQRDFKGHAHPLLTGRQVGKGLACAGDLFRCEGRLNSARWGVAQAVVVQVSHNCVTKQSAVAVNPFHDLNVAQGLVAVDGSSGGAAGRLRAPCYVGFGFRRGKLLSRDSAVNEVEFKPSPAVAVVDNRFRGSWIGIDKRQDPVVLHLRPLFVNGEAGRVFKGLGSVKSVARHPRGGFGFPAVQGFKSEPVVRAVFAGKNGRHETSVTNLLKTQQI